MVPHADVHLAGFSGATCCCPAHADPPAGAIYIQPNDNRNLQVFADTVTILPGSDGVFSKRGDSKATSGQSGLAGQDGKSVKIVARSLLCGGGAGRCRIDTSGGRCGSGCWVCVAGLLGGHAPA